MKTRWIEASLWSIATTGVVVAIQQGRNALRRPEAPAPVIWSVSAPLPTVGLDSLAILADRIEATDVFRLDRQPATVAYRQPTDTPFVRPNAQPTQPKPLLSLAGIIGGPPWAALLDGVPGYDGTMVVHGGDGLAGLRVVMVSPHSVVVTGMDTTWRLVVKRPWP